VEKPFLPGLDSHDSEPRDPVLMQGLYLKKNPEQGTGC
jgi:hypothetical protein